MASTTRRWAVAAACVLLSGGCAAASGPSLPEPLPMDVPFAYHLQTGSGGDGALLEGTLELVDGCLVVMPEYEGWDDPVVPVVPIATSSWDGSTFTVNGESSVVGERIALGGGYHADPSTDAFVPQSCPAAGEDRYFTVGIP